MKKHECKCKFCTDKVSGADCRCTRGLHHEGQHAYHAPDSFQLASWHWAPDKAETSRGGKASTLVTAEEQATIDILFKLIEEVNYNLSRLGDEYSALIFDDESSEKCSVKLSIDRECLPSRLKANHGGGD